MLRMLVVLGYSRTDLQLLGKPHCFYARLTKAKFIFPFQSRNDEIEAHDLSSGHASFEAAGFADRSRGRYLNQHQHRRSVSDAS